MGRLRRRSILRQQIAEILGTDKVSGQVGQPLRRHPVPGKSLIFGGMALLAMNPSQVSAIGLGELVLQSSLGEPLQAVVPMTVGHGEALDSNCIKATSRRAGLRAPSGVRVSSPVTSQPGRYDVKITTTEPLYEPMYELSLAVDCPRVPLIVHHYTLLFDLAAKSLSAPAPVLLPASPDPEPGQPPIGKPAVTTRRSLASTHESIPAGTQYRVRNGDTLSAIAERVAGRPPGTIWRVANHIFMTNEHAFIRNNADLIKLGSVIDIPHESDLTALSPPSRKTESSRPAADAPAPSAAQKDTLPASAESPQPAVRAAPVISSPFVDKIPPPARIASEPETGNVVADVEAVQVTEVARTPPADPSENSTVLAIGIGIVLGFSLSLLILRERLTDAIRDLFRNGKHNVLSAVRSRRPAQSSSDTIQSHADTLVSETSEFLDTLAEDAFATKDQYAVNTGLIPVGNPDEDTYIVEVDDANSDPTLREVEALPEAEETVEVDADPEIGIATADNLAIPIEKNTDPGRAMSGETLLAYLFDEKYEKSGEVIDPTADMPVQDFSEAIDPTADMPVQDFSEAIDPTADMPMAGADSEAPTVEMPKKTGNDTPDHTSQIPMDAFGIDRESLPNEDDDAGALTNTLANALSLLDREYEDEFTSSQILEGTAIRKSLDEQHPPESDSDDRAEDENIKGRTQTG